MSAAAHLIASHQHFITAHVQAFRETGNVFLLFRAMALIFQQRRALELVHGAYCTLFHPPSALWPENEGVLIPRIKNAFAGLPGGFLSRERIVELYSSTFRVELLPSDFCGSRTESVWQEENFLVIGEYGDYPRIAWITADACVVSEHYRQTPGVRHIHAIQQFGSEGQFLVSTGDTRKLLDLWSVQTRGVAFVRRMKRHLAGFTAAIEINSEYYFGTDFSGRPNWIETLGGRKFFFPSKAYRLQVADFYGFLNRYIVAINTELVVVGGRRTLSVFDTATERFLYCEYWSPLAHEPLEHGVESSFLT